MSKPGRYSKVYRRMWVDEKVKRLSQPPPCGFTLFQRLLTGPELTNIPGLFPAWEGGLASALHWPIEAFREAFAELIREGLVEADWDAGLVWVPNAIEYNEPESINVVIAWGETIKELPDCKLKLKAFAKLEAWAMAKGKAWEEAWAKAYPMPSAMPCPMGDRGASPIQEQEQEQEQERDQRVVEPPPAAASRPARRVPEVPTAMPEDWKPSDSLVAALAEKCQVSTERISACVPEFRVYWTEGKGAGTRRGPRGWALTFGKRIQSMAERGELYVGPGYTRARGARLPPQPNASDGAPMPKEWTG